MPRPVMYTEEIADQVIDQMAEGFSLTAAAAGVGFSRQTIYVWAEKYPEFGERLDVGRGLRLLKLERDLLSGSLDGPSTTARIFALKNADALEWRESSEVRHSGGITFETVYEAKPGGDGD